MTTASPSSGERLGELSTLKRQIRGGPGLDATSRQHAKGKLAVRERLDLLLDKDSFTEVEPFRRHRATGFGLTANRPHTDGVVTGWGTVHGRTIFVYAHDFRIFGGSLGEAHAAKIHKIMDMAVAAGAPLVSLNDGAGARIQEGVAALAGYGGIFQRNTRASGIIPQISVILGPCAGGAAYSPALTDFVFAVQGISQVFVTGPEVVRAVTGEQVSLESLGGTDVHAGLSGVVHFGYQDEETCLAEVRFLLSMLPSNNRELPPAGQTEDPPDRPCDRLLEIVPSESGRAYDVREVIEELVDDQDHMEVHALWAPNLVCTLARLGGQVVGIVANQPSAMAGVLDIKASEKGARFVQFCDAFNLPLVTLVDVPGFLPGVGQEHDGIVRRGAKLLYAYCNATVPRISVVLRKAYGGAYIVMDSRSIGADVALAWPGNEIAVMGAEAAVNVLYRREIAAASDPDLVHRQKVAEYQAALAHPYYAAERGLIDDVIDPRETRSALIGSLAMLHAKDADLPRRKHGNPPQ